ncbi:DUF2550 family protein [Scrofimicrobium sp. R131]|uniref:DUF2550 family protein n=1 Tax=Scrofimicrobium appendicitidis TaxID=3079930 RepID=A0AAU7V8H6_9ACTO
MTWLVLIPVLILLVGPGGFLLGRIYVLSHRLGSFRTLLRVIDPKEPSHDSGWMRGYARYGRSNMAWSGLVRFRVTPDLLLARTSLELVEQPRHHPTMGTSVLHLRDGDCEYEMVLSTGDYEGVISWIDSAPPGIS